MIEPRVQLDGELGPAEKLREPLEQQVTSALRSAVRKVEKDYDGESVDEVNHDLIEATRDGLHPDIAEGIAPDEHQLRTVAEEIVEENR